MVNEKDINFSEHLVELRKRCLLSLIFFLMILTISFYFVPQLIVFLKTTTYGVSIDLNIFDLSDALYIYLRLAGLVAIIATTPFFLLQLWLFVKPGLEQEEIRLVRRYIPLLVILFFLGIAFSYMVIIPYYIMFSSGLAHVNDLQTVIGVRAYIDFIVKTVWPFGLAFELPVLIHVLSRVGLVNYDLLKAIRGYAYIGLMIISALLTPPDPVSMGIMLIPLSILYESSVWIAKRNDKRRKRKRG